MAAAPTTDELAAFRQRCVDFLTEHAVGLSSDADDPRGEQILVEAKAYQAEVADAGLAGLMFPTEFGGQGLSAEHERIWREESGNFPAMTGSFTISQGMCLPMLDEYGTDELRGRYQAKLIRGEEVWCQMFSEPGAGSDVASLQSRAERDGDEWILNGQKVWTTLAHVSDRGIVIARTDPDQPKHRGISMFIVDMRAPGVEIRPIHQIDGGRRFNEVFFTDVRIPADHQIGPLNEGWRLATAMLMYERVAIGSSSIGGVTTDVTDALIAAARATGRIADPRIRQEIAAMYARETAQSVMALRGKAALRAGQTPGPSGSLGKLMRAVISRRTRELLGRIHGPSMIAGDGVGGPGKATLGTFASSIAGGTDEIQRNIIGERVLGLPREPSVDKDLPFRDLRVGTQRT